MSSLDRILPFLRPIEDLLRDPTITEIMVNDGGRCVFIERDGYVSFTWAGGGPYPKGLGFVKIVKGIPGDVVTVQGRDFYVNGVKVATAKERSLKGQPLDLGPTGIIPPGHYFVWTPHKDSLDSRYQLTGWVKKEQITGRAVPLL